VRTKGRNFGEPIALRLPEPVNTLVRETAKKADRTVAEYLRDLIVDAISAEHYNSESENA
jgi:hypothetical protein